jgi:hypothetical protein
LDNYIYPLIGKNQKSCPQEPDTHPSGIWPTTRQGDELQEKIAILEARLKALEC